MGGEFRAKDHLCCPQFGAGRSPPLGCRQWLQPGKTRPDTYRGAGWRRVGSRGDLHTCGHFPDAFDAYPQSYACPPDGHSDAHGCSSYANGHACRRNPHGCPRHANSNNGDERA